MGKLTADANFKAVFRNKKVALKFIKLLIPELERSSKDEVLGYEVIGEEIDEDSVMTEEEAEKYIDVEEALDYLPDSERDEKNKEIVHDILFSYKSDVIPTRNSVITVDCEMEGQRQNYKIARRGTYYAAKLHTQTIEKGSSYNSSNKVYSIWLLNYANWKDEVAVRSVYQAITYTRRGQVELRGEKKEAKSYDRESDGMEIVYIELPKIDKSDICEELKDMLLSIRDGDDIIEVIKKTCGLAKKEAEIMQSNLSTMNVKTNPYIEMGRQEGMKEGMREGMRKNKIETAIKMIKKGIDIETVKEITGLTEEEIRALM